MRETVLSHLRHKRFPEIAEILKDNKLFNSLLEDDIFKQIFFQNFIHELLNQEELEITYPAFLYNCHASNDFIFEFTKEDESKVLRFLIDKTREYRYALKLPDYQTSVEIIASYNSELETAIEKEQKVAQKHRDFEIVEKYANNTVHLVKSIFNSPQEKEFYLACKKVFPSHLILPNVSLTTLFNQSVVKEKFPEYFSFYQKSSIDFVIVDGERFIPILFFELDSKTYHSSAESQSRDEIKNILLTDLGGRLIRVTKKTGKESVDEYVNFLKLIKEENM